VTSDLREMERGLFLTIYDELEDNLVLPSSHQLSREAGDIAL